MFIYVLQLEEGKYYVGKTTQPSFRIESHFHGSGSSWTKKYKPQTVLEMIPNCDSYDEDKHTIRYMEKYGIQNVRGGSFCQINLSEVNLSTLHQMIKGATDKCYICGKSDHFARDCKRTVKEKIVVNGNEKCDCPTSFFSHRRKKCAFTNLLTYFEEEDDNIDTVKRIFS
jgi:hypothetical protein